MTPERREEVRQLLRATARHLAAKERGRSSQLGFGRVAMLDESGVVISSWTEIGPITLEFKDVNPEVIDLLLGRNPEEGECHSCGNEDDYPLNECPQSTRRCGHHCNHVISHDNCHWCGFEEPWR